MKPKLHCLQCVCLALIIHVTLAVEVKVTRTKPKKNGLVLMKAKCTYKVTEDIPTATFNITLDTDITKFKSRKVTVLGGSGSSYHVTNVKKIREGRFSVVFQGFYEGDAATPIPTGTCSELLVPTTSSTSATTSTQTVTSSKPTVTSSTTTAMTPPQNLPYVFPATMLNSWNLTSAAGTRFSAHCDFAVDESMQPETKLLGISMGVDVHDFEHYTGTLLSPVDSLSGSWFLVTNKYHIHPPKMGYKFQATHDLSATPNVICHSELPAYTTSTVKVTTPLSTTSTAAQTSTTQSTTSTATQTSYSTTPVKTSTTSETTAASSTTQSTQQSTGTTQATTTSGDDGVPLDVTNFWQEGANVRIQGECVFTITQEYAKEEFEIKLVLSSPSLQYVDWNWNAVDAANDGRWYIRSNKDVLTSSTVTYRFQVSALGTVPPTGRCFADGGGGVMSTTTPSGTTGTTIEITTIPFNSTFNYADAIHKSMLFYYAQRSGPLPSDNPIPWRGDSALGDQGENGEDLTGGWYDAGDMVKFNFPMSSSVTFLALGMYRWPQAYETIGLTDKMLDTLRWPLDYLLKCWNGDTENPRYYAQVGNGEADHRYWGRPEDMTMERPAYFVDKSKPGSDVTAETAAAMALGSELFRESDPGYADELLTAAEQLYDFADTARGAYSDSIPEAAPFYRSWSGYTDELMFAAAILYQVTGSESYLSKARQAHQDGAYDTDFEKAWGLSWDDKRIAAQLMMYELTGEQKYRDLVDNFLDRYRGESVPDSVPQTPQGLAWRDNWGVLRYAANAAFLALMAADSGIDTGANRAWAASQIDYMLGDNQVGRSYVIGVGDEYPRRPHHRAASCPLKPAPCDWQNYQTSDPNPHDIMGALVGGPDLNDDFQDDRNNFQSNEVACDYNAGFQSALAGLVQLVDGTPGTVSTPLPGTSSTTTESPGSTTTTQSTPETTTTTATLPGRTTTTEQQVTTTCPDDGEFNYAEVLNKSILFYRAQESGHLPDPLPWKRSSALYDGDDVSLDLTGGWYDAGDYVKFNLPISSAVTILAWGVTQWRDAYVTAAGDYVKFNLPISSAVTILAWGVTQWRDAYVTAGNHEEMLKCIRWPLDFFLKCWREQDQEFYAQVGNGDIDHAWMGRAEDMTASTVPRPAYKVTRASSGSDVAGNVAAAFAAGAIAFKTADPSYSATLLDAARSLYTFADTYRAKYTDEVHDAAEFYMSSGYNDELVYAAAMLYKATGEAGYLTDAENKYQQFGFDYQTSWAFDWDSKMMAAKLLLYEATQKTMYSLDVTSFLRQWRPGNNVEYTAGGLAYRSQWGVLRYTANTAFLALVAADLGLEPGTNEAWARSQIHYMLGDNPRGSSYVVGYGNNPPRRPHHKGSTCQPSPASCQWAEFSADVDNAHVLYGALVGGPNKQDGYVDDRKDYVMAEVTCDYNAGFQSAVAGLIHFDISK